MFLTQNDLIIFQATHINQISKVSEENDKCVLLNYQIPNITYSGGGTNTFGALLKAKVFNKYKNYQII